MTIVFISDYLNHYQAAFADAVFRHGEVEYWFVSCNNEISEERKQLGYPDDFSELEYVLYVNNDAEKVKGLINNSEIVISSYMGINLIRRRLADEKITFLVTERLFKAENDSLKEKLKNKLRLFKYKNRLRNVVNHSCCYYLLIGQYAIEDHIKCGVNPGRILKFAYFPEQSKYTEKEYSSKHIRLLWVGRLISWKHPDYAINVTKRLINDGIDVSLNIVGTGEMEQELKENANGYAINFTGGIPSGEIREIMNQSDIMLFTSNYGEGWGCVLNEAMSEGDAVVASSMAGSTTFLVKPGSNGLVYDGTEDGLYDNLIELIRSPSKIEKYGVNGRETIESAWNGDIAVDNLIVQYNRIISGEDLLEIDGPCGKYCIDGGSR